MKNKIADLLNKENKDKYDLPDYYYQYIHSKGYLNKNMGFIIPYIENIVNKYNLQNKKILEIGSHFGFEAILFDFLGVKNYTGIEFKEDSINIANKLKKILDIKNIDYMQGDVERLDFHDNSFDFVYCHSVASHIPDYLKGYSEIYRVLKPCGKLFFRDENNFLKNRKFRRINWKKADIGPKEISKEVGIDIPYIELRKNILNSKFPKIKGAKLEEIANLTYGYTKEDLLKAAQILINGGKIKKMKVARDPITGFWGEREINPINEMKILRKIGFEEIKIVSFYNKNKKRPFYKTIILRYLENNAWPYLFRNTHFNIEAKKPNSKS